MEGKDLEFAVNGERFKVNSVDPSTTLLDFLRLHTPFKSVKLCCGEGGCGACLVMLSKYDPDSDQVKEHSINSCLTLLCSINGCSITTSEGLGNTKNGFHPIHSRFAGFHASQCGFCTPGMCISLYSALSNAPGSLTVSEAEKSIAGNLCRCTGYRPIVDACKSFAADVDIEDLGLNSFWKKGDSKEAMLKSLPPYNPKDHLVTTFPEFLKSVVSNGLDHSRYHWTTPFSLTELHNILESANAGGSLKLVVGNTGTGYYKDDEGRVDRYVDISRVPEITMIKRDENGIEIGAAVTISNAVDALNEEGKSFAIFKKMAAHMEKIGNHAIRNSGSIGGNLVMAQSRKFPSDIATLLLAADASVYVFNGGVIKKVKLHEFLDSTRVLDTKQVLLKVEIPAWTDDAGLLFETYRAAPRSIGNALPYVSAAFFARVSRQMVDECLLAFGSYGGDHSIRATEVERFLTGKLLSHSVLYEAMCLLRGIIVPSKGTSYPEYRKALAVGFLFEFFSPLIDDNNGHSNGRVDPTESLLPFLSSSQQVLESNEFQPVGEAVIKAGAAIQASGEAVYVDDIPTLPDCLHGAFIYSTEPLAKIKSISFSENVTPAGVFAVLTFRDIPQQGQNIGSKTVFGPGPLFAEELTRCAGQRIALVVADTQKHADRAAKLAVVEYDLNNLEEPILTVEDAVKRSSFFDVHPMFYPEPVGDVLEGMKEADRKILLAEFRLGSQYFFYMEPQTALALPDEDNCVKVFSSSQAPEYVHSVIATCLGIPEHNVRVITRRVGGGFGGKAIKSMPVATACALAAHKLQRPVKMYLNRKTDMIMAGGRHPMKVTYNVGFRSDGKLTALELTMLIDAGMEPDVSPILPRNIMGPLRKYDWGALSFDVKVCKTNLLSRTAMRAPGEVQGSYIAEAIIENVASSLQMEADEPFDDPFGESPFKAFTSTDTDSNPQQSFGAPFQPTPPAFTSEASHTDTAAHNFGFEDSFSAVANPETAAQNVQPPSNSPSFPQEQFTSDIDILAGILPPSGPPASLPQQSGAPAPTSQFPPSGNNMYEGYHPQPVTTAPNMPGQTPFGQAVQPYNMVPPHSQNMTGATPYHSGGFMHQPGSANYNPGAVTSSSSQTPYSNPSGPAGQFVAHQGHGMPPSHGPQRTQSGPVTMQGNNNFMGDMFSQPARTNSLSSSSSQPDLTPLTGAIEVVPQPQKKFEPKSSIWADTLSRGLVNFNISGPKTNPLADIGVDFEAINRREKRLEKPTNAPAATTSTINMGKAMGSGTGLGRAGANSMRPPPNPMVGAGMPMGGVGMGVGGYGGMNQNQPMGMGMGPGMNMNQNQPMGMGMGPGMNMGGGYGQGYQMQPQNQGMVPGQIMPGNNNNNYNPMMGQGGYNPQQQQYGGGYR